MKKAIKKKRLEEVRRDMCCSREEEEECNDRGQTEDWILCEEDRTKKNFQWQNSPKQLENKKITKLKF